MALNPPALLRLLRRCHAWVGLSGAAFGLLFGVTGILQNHRSVMKVDLGRIEVKRAQVELEAPLPSPEALVQALHDRMGWDATRISTRVQPARGVKFQGAPVTAAAQWTVTYNGHKHFSKATYTPGNRTVDLEQKDANLIETLSRLHKADAGQVGWILVADALALGLIFMSLSGILLWTRLSGPRLLASGLSLAGVLGAVLVVSRAW